MANETKNVKISVANRFKEEVEPDIAVRYEDDLDFDGEAQDEWVEPRLLGFSAVPRRRGTRTELWTLNVNCFHRISDRATDSTNRIDELVDTVLGLFSQVDVVVKDWQDAQLPTLTYLRLGEGSVTSVVEPAPPAGKIVQQKNISFDGVLVL